MMEGFEAVLAAGHLALVVQLVESCVQWEERQSQLLQRLLQVSGARPSLTVRGQKRTPLSS